MIPAILPTYARADVTFERGEGPYLIATDGRKYLDFGSGVAVTALGHAHPHLIEALTAQAQKLWHCSNLYQIAPQQRAAERLVAASFADTVFFCNSGAEAMEGAIKVARKYHAETGHPEKYHIIACTGSFHGRTLATLAAAGNERYLRGFGPPAPGFEHVPYNDLAAMRAAIKPETAAILIEPVQGEGGLATATPEYLKGVRALCDQHGILLVMDEVQSGMGRTGKLFAHEWAGVPPDVMAVAKALGNGLPVGACLATEKAAVGMVAGSHGSTFGGNPLAMAAGNAVLDVMLEPGFFERTQRMARLLWGKLEALVGAYPKLFAELRGSGHLLGIRCQPNLTAGDFVAKLRAEGLLCLTAGDNVLRILPPLIVGEREIEEGLGIINKVAKAWPAS